MHDDGSKPLGPSADDGAWQHARHRVWRADVACAPSRTVGMAKLLRMVTVSYLGALGAAALDLAKPNSCGQASKQC